MGLYMVLFLQGMEGTTPAEGAIILASAPIFTFFLSCALKQEAFTWPALLGSTIAFVGVGIVILGGSPAQGHGSLLGNLTVLVSAVVWALNVVAMRPLLAKYDATRVFTLSLPGALPVALAFGLLPALHYDYLGFSLVGWLSFGQMTVLSGVIAFVAYYVGVNQIGAIRAGMYQFCVPPLAAVFQWIVFGKPLGWLQWAGMLVVLAGMIYVWRARSAMERKAFVPATALE
jgi:drug/metabolite transporter (DMT)-like permease